MNEQKLSRQMRKVDDELVPQWADGVAALEAKLEAIVRSLESWEAMIVDSRLPEDITAKAVCKSMREIVRGGVEGQS